MSIRTNSQIKTMVKERMKQSLQLMNAESQSIACIHDAKTKQINRIRKVFASSIKPHHLAPNKTESLRHLSSYLENTSLLAPHTQSSLIPLQSVKNKLIAKNR